MTPLPNGGAGLGAGFEHDEWLAVLAKMRRGGQAHRAGADDSDGKRVGHSELHAIFALANVMNAWYIRFNEYVKPLLQRQADTEGQGPRSPDDRLCRAGRSDAAENLVAAGRRRDLRVPHSR